MRYITTTHTIGKALIEMGFMKSEGIDKKELYLDLPKECSDITCICVHSVIPPVVLMYANSFSDGGEILRVHLEG